MPATPNAPAGLTVQPPDLHPPAPYIVVEGPIGVGKTALAEWLASRWTMRAIFERAESNPFLAPFNTAGGRHALPAQLQFLLQRSALSEAIAAADGKGETLIADFLPHKSDLYARIVLSNDEFELYRALAARMTTPTRTPDLVIYLQADAETLLLRQQKRAPTAEPATAMRYLPAICQAYDVFFYHYDEAPVLTVNTRHFNPLDSQADRAMLLERIAAMRGRKETFVKGSP
jgi:deoxyguanosine kinase